jgi:methyl-accepting chemotaxis protein
VTGVSRGRVGSGPRVRFGIGWRLAVVLAAALLLCSVGLVAFLTNRSLDAMETSLTASSTALARVLARDVAQGLEFNDKIGVQETLRAATEGASLTYATVRKPAGDLFVGINSAADPALRLESGVMWRLEKEADSLHVVQRMGNWPAPFGTVHIGVSLADVHAAASASLRLAVVILLVIAGVALGLGLLLDHYFARPVRALAEASVTLAAGDLTGDVQVSSTDEVGLLADAFREMLASQRQMVVAIRGSADSLSQVSKELGEVGASVSDGFAVIKRRVDDTSQAITKLAGTLADVEENVTALESSADSGSHTIVDVAQASRGVLDKIEVMRTAVESTSRAISSSAKAIQVTAANLSELTQGLDAVVASVSEIAEATTQVRHDTSDTARLSAAAAAEARRGGELMRETLDGIGRIRTSSQAVANALKALVGSTARIGEVTTVIDEVTAKTNLLALNASIIAAQAGQHGRSFSVVASEIKALADATRHSTGEITTLVSEVQLRSQEALAAMAVGLESVEAGMDVGKRADRAFQRIVASADETSERMKSIAGAANRQSEAVTRARPQAARISESARIIEGASTEQSRVGEQAAHAAQEIRALTNDVHTFALRQCERSQEIVNAIQDITRSITKVEEAQKVQASMSTRVSSAASAIALVTVDRATSVQRLETVIAALQKQVTELQQAVMHFRA